jgi:hypothetical protein
MTVFSPIAAARQSAHVSNMSARKLASIALFSLLAGCQTNDDINSTEAIQAADAEIAKVLNVRSDRADVKVEDDHPRKRWRVEFYSGTGAITVYVDRQSGKATIAMVEQ